MADRDRSSIMRVAFLACTFFPISVSAQSPVQKAGLIETPQKSPSAQVSLSMSLRGKKNVLLQSLQPTDFIVHDGATVVDQRNVTLSEDHTPPLVTLVFGRLDDADTRRAASVARKVLKGMSETQSPIAVLQIADTIRLLHVYTADKNVVDESLQLLSSGNKRAIADVVTAQEQQLSAQVAQGGSGLQQDLAYTLQRSLKRAPSIANEQHISPGIASLTASAEAQKTIPGRKAIVFFTAETPSGVQSGKMFRSLYETLTDASVSLYVVDMRGMDRNADQGMMAAIAAGSQAAAVRSAVAAAPANLPGTNSNAATGKTLGLTPMAFERMSDTISAIEMGDIGRTDQNPLASVASITGGNYNDVDGSGSQLGRTIDADLRHCYTITFPATRDTQNGRFHAVNVQLSLKDVKVASTLGYLDLPEPDAAEDACSQPLKVQADVEWKKLEDGLPAKELQPEAVLRTTSSGVQEVALQVPVGHLELRKDNNTKLFSLHATLGAELEDSKGATVARFSEDFNREGTSDNEAKVRETDLRMSRMLNLSIGKYQLHAVVHDWFSSKLGETTSTVTITSRDTDASESLARKKTEPVEKDPALVSAALNSAHLAAIEDDLVPSTGAAPPLFDGGALIEAARKNALSYTKLLPNFLCVERIDRSTDSKGMGSWNHQDTLFELLRYEDHLETRKVLEINGEKSNVAEDTLHGVRSTGEFGGILQIIFKPEAQAVFHFERTMQHGDDTLYVFSFKLNEAKSDYVVTDGSGTQARAGLRGFVYIDSITQSVRRMLAQTDELPHHFGVRSSWMSLEYSEVPIGKHEYLLPTRGEVGLQYRKQEVNLLQLSFSDYRRFAARSAIRFPTEESLKKDPQ